MHLQAKGRSGSDSPTAYRGRMFSAYYSVNCLLHISINYTEIVTDLYAHAQTVDTRRSSPNFQAPGYEANLKYFCAREGDHFCVKLFSSFVGSSQVM